MINTKALDDTVTETGLMLAAEFDALALRLGQPIPLPGATPAWAEDNAEAQRVYLQIKREFPDLNDECAWCLIGESFGA